MTNGEAGQSVDTRHREHSSDAFAGVPKEDAFGHTRSANRRMARMPEESRNVSSERSKTTSCRPSTCAVAVRRKRSISARSNSPDSHRTPSRSHRICSGWDWFFTVYAPPVCGAATIGRGYVVFRQEPDIRAKSDKKSQVGRRRASHTSNRADPGGRSEPGDRPRREASGCDEEVVALTGPCGTPAVRAAFHQAGGHANLFPRRRIHLDGRGERSPR